MPDDSLAPRGGGGDLTRFTPEVRTLARPQAIPLIGARGVVHRSPALQATFQQARAEGWTPERLAGAITPELEQALECEPEASVEVAQYLADEYFQLGDAVLICDRTTGKAIARISDADMYQPPDQVRESGNLAKPLPRLNPNLEGFLVSYIFEQERDRQLRADILATLPGTEFLAEHGDPRIAPVTRAGRAGIAQTVRESLPDVLQAVQGSARAFLDYFELTSATPRSLDPLPRQTATASGSQNIVDPKAMNLRFSWEATIRARTGAGWVREMAAHLLNEASQRIRPDLRLTVPYPLLSHDHVEGRSFWAGEPNTCIAIQRALAGGRAGPPPTILPCTPGQTSALGFMGSSWKVGTILIHPESYEFTTREVHGRWDMVARMQYTLCVDWDRVRFLHVTDIPITARAEIL